MAIGSQHQVRALQVAVNQRKRNFGWAMRVEPGRYVTQDRKVLNVSIGRASPFVDAMTDVGVPIGRPFESGRQ